MDSGIMQAFLMKVQSVFRQLLQEQVDCFAAEWFFFGNGREENNPPRWSIVSHPPISCEKSQNHYHPLGMFGRFFRGQRWKKQRSFRGCFSHIHPLKNRWNRGGDDRQVSQNGMPFCTGCTLSGHILNLQGSSTPFEPLVSSPKNETAKHPLEVSPFHFWIRREMCLSHLVLRKQMFIQVFC